MKRAIAALVVGASLPVAGAAQEQPLLLFQTAITPEPPVWVGQRMTLTLTALTPVRFAAPPAFPDLAGLPHLVVLPEATTVPGTIRIGSISYAALERGVAIFPTEAGEIVLPSLSLDVEVGGPDGQPVRAQATAPGPSVRARVPAGVVDLKRLVVAPSFRLTASTDRSPEGLRVGEALTRSIRMEADDTAAMLLPPALWVAPEGVAVYPDPPALQDRTDRGVLHAARSERAAYVPQRTGQFEVPGFTVSWLRPQSGEVQVLQVPTIRLEVLPVVAPRRSMPSWPILAGAAACIPLLGVALLWARRSRTPRDPAALAFDDLAAACHRSDAAPAFSALLRWCGAVMPGAHPGGPVAVAAASATPSLAEAALALERHLYAGQGGSWSGDALLAAVRSARHRLGRRVPRHAAPSLPPLNPSAVRMAG